MKLMTRLLPFMYLGIMIVVLIAGLFIFSYLLIVGAAIGLVLFAVTWAREFFSKTSSTAHVDKKVGRIIEHDRTK